MYIDVYFRFFLSQKVCMGVHFIQCSSTSWLGLLHHQSGCSVHPALAAPSCLYIQCLLFAWSHQQKPVNWPKSDLQGLRERSPWHRSEHTVDGCSPGPRTTVALTVIVREHWHEQQVESMRMM